MTTVKIKVELVGNIQKQGSGLWIRVPKDYINVGALNTKDTYTFTLTHINGKEVKE